ncbi:MAG: hypothetical protein ACKVU0_05310 [Saprospiraceae bacterium]
MPELGQIIPLPKTGKEHLTFQDQPLDTRLLDFWRWSMSDLVSNATRGIFAEFIVAQAMDISHDSIRDEWAPYDLISPEGIKIEVKSAAYLQSWAQHDFSKIGFSIAPARFWNPQTNEYSSTPGRSSDVYVFCLLKHKESETLNPLKLDQWVFYVVPTVLLIERFPTVKSLGLKSLEKITDEIGFDGLREKVLGVFKG